MISCAVSQSAWSQSLKNGTTASDILSHQPELSSWKEPSSSYAPFSWNNCPYCAGSIHPPCTFQFREDVSPGCEPHWTVPSYRTDCSRIWLPGYACFFLIKSETIRDMTLYVFNEHSGDRYLYIKRFNIWPLRNENTPNDVSLSIIA